MKTSSYDEQIAEANRLLAESERLREEAWLENVPERWEVGMRVRYIREQEWVCGAGTEAIITAHMDEREGKNPRPAGSEYQVFWCSPDDRAWLCWTTPRDVIWIPEKTS